MAPVSLLLLLLVLAWPCLAMETHCCEHLLLDDRSQSGGLHPTQGNRLGFYAQLGEYGARPAYR